MGNCFGSQPEDPNSSSSKPNTSIRFSTLGTSSNYSNDGGFSATCSSAGRSRFSAAASEASEDTCLTGDILPTPNLKIFNFADLKNVTRNFKSDMVLGKGGFGTVFKGWVDEKTLAPAKYGTGMMVAIKKLNSESIQGFDEWQAEVNFLGRLSHPNLVKLLGYCWDEKELLLVYEFMQKGSLDCHLFRRSSVIQPLSWDIRLKIAIGAARGLAFLHSLDELIIYRDFKASNILLDGVGYTWELESHQTWPIKLVLQYFRVYQLKECNLLIIYRGSNNFPFDLGGTLKHHESSYDLGRIILKKERMMRVIADLIERPIIQAKRDFNRLIEGLQIEHDVWEEYWRP